MSASVPTFRRPRAVHLSAFALLIAACATAQDPPPGDYDGTPTSHAGSSAGGSSSGSGSTPLPTAGTTVVPNGGSATAPKGGAPGSGGAATPAGGSVSATGGSVAATAGTASTSTCPQYAGTLAKDSVIFANGFGTATKGTWKGYGFTYKYGSALIAPGAGNGCFTEAKFCANGSVPADDKSGAGLGWNIGQMMGATTTTKVAIATPVTIKFAGVKAGMRAQLSASATVSYCYTFTAADETAGAATIPAASFKTECWGTTGIAYDGVVPIEAIQVAVPGSTTGAALTFDICLLDIEPG